MNVQSKLARDHVLALTREFRSSLLAVCAGTDGYQLVVNIEQVLSNGCLFLKINYTDKDVSHRLGRITKIHFLSVFICF